MEPPPASTGTLVLTPGDRATLAGTLTEDGLPLSDARLFLVSDPDDPMASMSGFADAPSARTDATGAFRFEDVLPGEYTLLVDHDTRAMPHREPVTVDPGHRQLDLDLDVTIVSGVVRDASGDPVAGARVKLERVRGEGAPRQRRMVFVAAITTTGGGGGVSVHASGEAVEPVETDAEGRYELRGVPSGVKLCVAAEADERSPAKSEPFELGRDERRDGVDVALRQGGGIAITVTRAGGAPAGGALVIATRLVDGERSGEPQAQVADEDGRVTLRDLEPGTWRVTAQELGVGSGEDESVEVEVVAGEQQALPMVVP